jgi:hypothetical protein
MSPSQILPCRHSGLYLCIDDLDWYGFPYSKQLLEFVVLLRKCNAIPEREAFAIAMDMAILGDL